jgi:Sec-independent protein translocase protein TatA
MFGFHPIDLLVALALIALIAGGKRLSGLGEALGKSVAGYRRGVRGEDEPVAAPDDESKAETLLLPEGKGQPKK